ncbi:hypothetical protein [Gemmatirosa kalamazoonensis]|uniref:hypothetical protein n=1 Tax=Gemmatirosa kalamazoonensis TaxID=861299 RepID=UPI0011DDF985|nr:hypothetical protein [Gemmatirosa kalamazoonensis]
MTSRETRTSAAAARPEPDVAVDAVGLGYRVCGGRLHVSYPHRGSDGEVTYRSGFALGALPPAYWTDPPNAITAARVALWTALIGYLRACAPRGDGVAARRHPSAPSEEDVDAASDMSFPASDPPAWMGSMACIASGDAERRPGVSESPNASAAKRAS